MIEIKGILVGRVAPRAPRTYKALSKYTVALRVLTTLTLIFPFTLLHAEIGDPQIATDHPFYPGELAISTFPRLFKSESDQYARITKKVPETDEEKALAAWYWRNTHYAHGEEGAEDLWGPGFGKGGDTRSREFWTGLFAHGFGLCGTTHSQWTAEMEYLLGHGRARGIGVEGHNSFEVFLKGGAYGEGRWVLLDHDISTIVYDPAGSRLLSIPEVKADLKNFVDRSYLPEKQHGWLVCGLAAGDGSVYKRYDVAEYLPGYAGPPPIVHLRRGETMRRYFEPGLENGKTFVFWGRNYNTAGIPGPERSLTWVNQPEKMHGSKDGTGHHEGQARYSNVVYIYHPDFRSNDYQEGMIEQTANYMTFEFYTPYIIAATPPNNKDWGIYDLGCRNGLIVRGLGDTRVEVSPDQGTHWFSGELSPELDLTDFVKGHRQYWLRFWASPNDLAKARIEIQTVCQAAIGVLPRLKEDGATVSYESSGRGIVSAGPNLTQAKPHIVAGKFDSPQVTLELATPHGEEALEIYTAAHVASGNPPTSDIKYQIEYSIDASKTWKPVVKDWTVPRQGEEPKDFWSQSMCYGSTKIEGDTAKVLVRFRNSGGRNYLRAEAHLVYRARGADAVNVTYFWTDSRGEHIESRRIGAGRQTDKWTLRTASNVRNRWVEIEDVAP
jgi:hypothetical protein